VNALRPRTAVDFALYPASVATGWGVWWWVLRETGADEAWDEGLYWPAMLVAAFALGVLLGTSDLPHVMEREPLPLTGIFIAAIMFLAQIPAVVVTSDGAGVSFLPLTLVLFWPICTMVFGIAATTGVLIARGARRALWRLRT
jgi:hypothetical protein